MDRSTNQFDAIAEELAGLLQWDAEELKAYTFLLSKVGEVAREEMMVARGLTEGELEDVIRRMEEHGLIVRGRSGFYPVHPRLGVSNVYRLSVLSKPSVRYSRAKVDALMGILGAHRDRLEETRPYLGQSGRGRSEAPSSPAKD
jgi:hypothetical protein